MATTIVLVRHGETDWNRDRRFQGRADQPLNETGRAQARELAESLRDEPVSVLYTSPLRRASETAEILAERLGLEARPLDALLEIDVGTWEGLTIDDVRVRFPEQAAVDWRSGWEDGETYTGLEQRVIPALLELGIATRRRTHPRGDPRRPAPRRDRLLAEPRVRRSTPSDRSARELRRLPIRDPGRRTRGSRLTGSWRTITRTSTTFVSPCGFAAHSDPRSVIYAKCWGGDVTGVTRSDL